MPSKVILRGEGRSTMLTQETCSMWREVLRIIPFNAQQMYLLSRNLGGFDRPGGFPDSSTSVAVDFEALSDISFSSSGGATVNIRVINTISQEACPSSVEIGFDICARAKGGLRTVLLLKGAGDARGLDGRMGFLLPDLIRWIFVPDFVLLAPNMHSKRSKSFDSVSRE